MGHRILAGLAIAVLVTVGLACRSTRKVPPLATSATIDLDRYMGAWHVSGRVDYFGERGDVASEDV